MLTPRQIQKLRILVRNQWRMSKRRTPSSEESTMDENTEAEGSETETNNEEAVDDEANWR